jgi:hypothetical protein
MSRRGSERETEAEVRDMPLCSKKRVLTRVFAFSCSLNLLLHSRSSFVRDASCPLARCLQRRRPPSSRGSSRFLKAHPCSLSLRCHLYHCSGLRPSLQKRHPLLVVQRSARLRDASKPLLEFPRSISPHSSFSRSTLKLGLAST